MRNPLQEQLLKAGLVKKGKVAQVVREQNKQRQGKASPSAETEATVDVAALQAERAARDRALAAERNAEARAAEVRAQLRQLIEHHRVRHAGETAYRFNDGLAIKTLWIDAALRSPLAAGQLLIVRLDDDYALVPRAAGDKIRERDPSVIVLDHKASAPPEPGSDDEYYAKFEVPDDLIW
ncbi:DUF2058 domain-containing protein [Frateuria aurantia]